jgi:hypothetical protein
MLKGNVWHLASLPDCSPAKEWFSGTGTPHGTQISNPLPVEKYYSLLKPVA